MKEDDFFQLMVWLFGSCVEETVSHEKQILLVEERKWQ